MTSKQMTFSQAVVSYQINKIILVLAGMFIFPLVVHLIPWQSSTPLGAMFLPIFYMPLIAVYRYRGYVPLIAAIFSPMLNCALMGMPAQKVAYGLTFELIVFIMLCQLLKKFFPRFWLNGVGAFVGAKFLSGMLLKGTAVSSSWTAGVSSAFIGLMILTIINVLVLRVPNQR